MKLPQQSPSLRVVSAHEAAPSQRAQGNGDSEAVRAAMAVHEQARAEVRAAEGAQEVAAAKLREARDSAPVSARLSRARAEVVAARTAAERGAQERTDAERAVADTEGALVVAQAELDDCESGAREKVRPAQLVRAQEAVAKAERLVTHTGQVLIACQESLAADEARLAAAEERLAQAEDDTVEHSSVIAARHKLAGCEGALAAARRREQQAAAEVATVRSQEATGEAEDQEPPVFASVDAFVEGYVLPNWRHVVDEGDSRWCALWWCHAEAVTVFEALWEAFEAMRRQPAPSLSTFLRDHFVPHMHNLTAKNGTFEQCSTKEGHSHHKQLPVWRHVYAPQGAFPTNPQSQAQPERDRIEEHEGESA